VLIAFKLMVITEMLPPFAPVVYESAVIVWIILGMNSDSCSKIDQPALLEKELMPGSLVIFHLLNLRCYLITVL